MHDTNWELIKFQYEVLGYSIADLALNHSVSEAVLTHSSLEWVRLPLAEEGTVDLKDIDSIDDVITKLQSKTISQSQAFDILKQKFLGPKYVELESILLLKAISIASELKSNDSKASTILKNLTTTLIELLSQNPYLNKNVDLKSGENDRTWKIEIVGSEKETDVSKD